MGRYLDFYAPASSWNLVKVFGANCECLVEEPVDAPTHCILLGECDPHTSSMSEHEHHCCEPSTIQSA
jgi:hypothetical protein